MVKDAFFVGKYEIPEIGSNSKELPDEVIPFDKALASNKYNQWVHFYLHDVEFERVWNNPKQYFVLHKCQQPDREYHRNLCSAYKGKRFNGI